MNKSTCPFCGLIVYDTQTNTCVHCGINFSVLEEYEKQETDILEESPVMPPKKKTNISVKITKIKKGKPSEQEN